MKNESIKPSQQSVVYDILDYSKVRLCRQGRRHKIGLARILSVVNTVDPYPIGDQLLFVGTDNHSVELEIILVPDNRRTGWAVIHAMPTAFRDRAGGAS